MKVEKTGEVLPRQFLFRLSGVIGNPRFRLPSPEQRH